MKRFLSVILSLSLVVSPMQASVCSATDEVAVQRNVTELINKLPEKLRVPVHKLLNGDPTWNATKLSLNETETRMLNEVLVEMHLAKRSDSLDGGVIHVGGEERCRRDKGAIRPLDWAFMLCIAVLMVRITRGFHEAGGNIDRLHKDHNELVGVLSGHVCGVRQLKDGLGELVDTFRGIACGLRELVTTVKGE